MILGCIADDFTGATDLANTLVRNGMRSVQTIGVPDSDFVLDDVDAIVVALKSRTIPAADAVAQSLRALEWLRGAGCRQFFFKYCSTFDSTPRGNIGPVTEALMQALDTDFSIACPAFPENGRTVFNGHLFVGDALLSESGMQHHPLTPMTDANLVRVLAGQCKGNVGLVPFDTVDRGAPAIADAFADLRSSGYPHAIVDAISDEQLMAIGTACADLVLITGGSGVAVGLPSNFRRTGLLADNDAADSLPPVDGLSAVLAGSCSTATLAQVERTKSLWPAFQIDPMAVADGRDVAAQAMAFASRRISDGPVLIYASAAPEKVSEVQATLGRDHAGELVEGVMAQVARELVALGVRKLVVAGGETSGAVVSALKVRALRIGPQIDPGVPWTASIGDLKLALALKSGNFGGPDFFQKALERVA
ncbi:MAG: hypothetical protein GWP69_16720 [Gammaproteobacteria bacterium]|jgi:uncharacterized protein YgbK (DUF1537 family)|nr:hypothetical protein [Gammaproteobacteria bacterium]NCF80270.1 hypothetical protein [Pseudomonadota bacterium]